MQLMKTFNTTALAVTVLIGSITTSCNSSQSESSDVNAVKLERIPESTIPSIYGITGGEKFKQFFWTYQFASREIFLKLKDNITPESSDFLFICFYASEKMEIDASESEAALKSYFLSSKPMYDQFIRRGAWEQYITNNTDRLTTKRLELKTDKNIMDFERNIMVEDWFISLENLKVHRYLSSEGQKLDDEEFSPYSINKTAQQKSLTRWFTPFSDSMPSKDELIRLDDDYLEEKGISSKRELKLEKDCFSPEEVDRIKFNTLIDIK